MIGYIPCALIIGLLVDKFETRRWIYPVSMLFGTIVLYAFGLAWFLVLTRMTLAKALMLCAVPFLSPATRRRSSSQALSHRSSGGR